LILRSPIPTGHFQQRPAAQLHLDEFQTHPLCRKKGESPPPAVPRAPLKSAMNSRNVTVSCLSRTPSPEQALSSRQRQPQTPKPRKDPAAHVSLPSDAIVKQREPCFRPFAEKPNSEAIPLMRSARLTNGPAPDPSDLARSKWGRSKKRPNPAPRS